MNVSPSKPSKKVIFATATISICAALASEALTPINQNVHSASPAGNKNELSIMMTQSSNNENPITNEASPRILFGLEEKSTLNADEEIKPESRSTKDIRSKGKIIPKMHPNQRISTVLENEMNKKMYESVGKITGMEPLTDFRIRAFDDTGEGQNKDLEFDMFGYTSMNVNTAYDVSRTSCVTYPNCRGKDLEWNSRKPEAATTYVKKYSPEFSRRMSKWEKTESLPKYFLGETCSGSDQNEIRGKLKQAEEAVCKLIGRMKKFISEDTETDDVPDIDVTSIIEAFTFMFLQPRNEKKKTTEKSVRNLLGDHLSSKAHPKLSRLFESGRLLILVGSNDDAPISSICRDLAIENEDRQNDPGITEKVEWLQNAKTPEEKALFLDMIETSQIMIETDYGTKLISKIAGSKTKEEKEFFQKKLFSLSGPEPLALSIGSSNSSGEPATATIELASSNKSAIAGSPAERMRQLNETRLFITQEQYEAKQREILATI